MTIIDIFVMPIRNGETSSFKREAFEEIMGRGAINPRPPFCNIEYADGGCEVFGADDEDISSLMIDHFGGETFFDRLWELAERTGSFFAWTGAGGGYAVTDSALLAHLPPGIADDPEPPLVVDDGRALEAAIFGYADDQK